MTFKSLHRERCRFNALPC